MGALHAVAVLVPATDSALRRALAAGCHARREGGDIRMGRQPRVSPWAVVVVFTAPAAAGRSRFNAARCCAAERWLKLLTVLVEERDDGADQRWRGGR